MNRGGEQGRRAVSEDSVLNAHPGPRRFWEKQQGKGKSKRERERERAQCYTTRKS